MDRSTPRSFVDVCQKKGDAGGGVANVRETKGDRWNYSDNEVEVGKKFFAADIRT